MKRAVPTPRDLVSLAKRMAYMQWLRVSLSGVVLLSAAMVPGLTGSTAGEVAPVSLSYAMLSGAAEVLRRAARRRQLWAVSAMLLVDGVYLAWVMQLTGGVESPLRFLIYVHVVAVSLLASYRTALKIAAWHSILLIVAFEAQATGLLGPRPEEGELGAAAFHLTALWIVAVATALFSGLNERELRRRRHDLEALADMAGSLETVESPREVANVLLDTVLEKFGFARGLVLGLGQDDLEVLASTSKRGPVAAPRGDALLEEAWDTRRPVLVRSVDEKENPFLDSALAGASNVVAFPMITEGRPVGALVVERPGLPRVHRRLVETAEQFAAHGALALRNAFLLEQVQFLAERDPLTGACNRRTFERELSRALSHAERMSEHLSLAMFDLDHFKQLNDRHGHQAGDEALRRAAAILETESRAFDTVARYGGEEFAVIMPGLSPTEALSAVERLRAAIGEVRGPLRVTASAGVASYPGNARDADSLIRYADEALYESKDAGRDRSTRSRRRGGLRGVARVAANG